MIVLDPQDAQWETSEDAGQCADVTVFVGGHSRVSELLGPDGEALDVPYERPALGFDLTPKGKRQAG